MGNFHSSLQVASSTSRGSLLWDFFFLDSHPHGVNFSFSPYTASDPCMRVCFLCSRELV